MTAPRRNDRLVNTMRTDFVDHRTFQLTAATPVYNLTGFGGKGDAGTTDNAAALTKALGVVDGLGGGIIYIPPGTYHFDDDVAVSIGAPIHIIGAGAHATELRASSSHATGTLSIKLTGDTTINVGGSFRDISYRGKFHLDAASFQMAHWWIDGIYFTDPNTDKQLHIGTLGYFCRVTRCKFAGVQHTTDTVYGIYNEANASIFSDNDFAVRDNAVSIFNSGSAIIIARNYFETPSNSDAQHHIASAGDGTIIGNHIGPVRNGDSLVELTGGKWVLEGNQIAGILPGVHGIHVNGATWVHILGNSFGSVGRTGAYAIYVEDVGYLVNVEDNVFHEETPGGAANGWIYAESGKRTHIRGNHCFATTAAAVPFADGPGVVSYEHNEVITYEAIGVEATGIEQFDGRGVEAHGRATITTDGAGRANIAHGLLAPPIALTSNTHTGSSGEATTFTDSSGDFVDDGVMVGDELYNLTDGSHGRITAVTATTITVASLSNGTDNDFDTGDEIAVRKAPRFAQVRVFNKANEDAEIIAINDTNVRVQIRNHNTNATVTSDSREVFWEARH